MSRYLIVNENDVIVTEVTAKGYEQMIDKLKQRRYMDYRGLRAYNLCHGSLEDRMNDEDQCGMCDAYQNEGIAKKCPYHDSCYLNTSDVE